MVTRVNALLRETYPHDARHLSGYPGYRRLNAGEIRVCCLVPDELIRVAVVTKRDDNQACNELQRKSNNRAFVPIIAFLSSPKKLTYSKARIVMKIAVLGWGSLVWDPRTLKTRSPWYPDGPELPIEFARESTDGRITLVITSIAPVVTSLWAESGFENLNAAIDNLIEREGINEKYRHVSIGTWTRDNPQNTVAQPVIAQWAISHKLDAVIWTNLKPRFKGIPKIPTLEEVLNHLRRLEGQQRKDAELYVRNAPKQVMTPYRREIEKQLGWVPAEDTDLLPDQTS